ncbi:MAG: hypothetical protein ACYTEQ_11570 [Planctomycetota bacterium]|jgi:hypothetical protein
MTNEKMQRVNKQKPCPVCSKPDWCLVAKDGSAAICARTEQGSIKRCGDAGWLHVLRENVHNVPHVHGSSAKKRKLVRIVTSPHERREDFEPPVKKYQEQLDQHRLNLLAEQLGVSAESLMRLKAGWDGQAYTFPMSDAEGRIIGIRRRFLDGRKVSVTGSRTGLFVPATQPADGVLVIVEGESDLAAALTLGFAAIGRPNCNSKIEMTAKCARGYSEIAIISDNDAAGRNGAEKLAEALVLYYPSVKIVCPPEGIKDLRQWLAAGLSRPTLQQTISNTKAIQVGISTGTET